MDYETVDFAKLTGLERDLALLHLIDKLANVTGVLGDRLETVENEMGYNRDEEYS